MTFFSTTPALDRSGSKCALQPRVNANIAKSNPLGRRLSTVRRTSYGRTGPGPRRIEAITGKSSSRAASAGNTTADQLAGLGSRPRTKGALSDVVRRRGDEQCAVTSRAREVAGSLDEVASGTLKGHPHEDRSLPRVDCLVGGNGRLLQAAAGRCSVLDPGSCQRAGDTGVGSLATFGVGRRQCACDACRPSGIRAAGDAFDARRRVCP